MVRFWHKSGQQLKFNRHKWEFWQMIYALMIHLLIPVIERAVPVNLQAVLNKWTDLSSTYTLPGFIYVELSIKPSDTQGIGLQKLPMVNSLTSAKPRDLLPRGLPPHVLQICTICSYIYTMCIKFHTHIHAASKL